MTKKEYLEKWYKPELKEALIKADSINVNWERIGEYAVIFHPEKDYRHDFSLNLKYQSPLGHQKNYEIKIYCDSGTSGQGITPKNLLHMILNESMNGEQYDDLSILIEDEKRARQQEYINLLLKEKELYRRNEKGQFERIGE